MDADWFRFMGACSRLRVKPPQRGAFPVGLEMVRLTKLLERVEARVWKRMHPGPRSIEQAVKLDGLYGFVDPNGMDVGVVNRLERRARAGRGRFWGEHGSTSLLGQRIDPRPHAVDLGNPTTHEEVAEGEAGAKIDAFEKDRKARQRAASARFEAKRKAGARGKPKHGNGHGVAR